MFIVSFCRSQILHLFSVLCYLQWRRHLKIDTESNGIAGTTCSGAAI